MAKSMIKRRQEAERQRNAAYEATLRHVFSVARPAPDFERALDEARAGLPGYAIRDGALWRPKLKTRDAGRLRLAAARWLYARYPGADTATSTSSHPAEATAASGVRAPASRLGTERFSEPQLR